MTRSILIVYLQIACMIFLAITGKIIPSPTILLIPWIIFMLLGFLAMLEMKFRFNVVPELITGSKLVTSGPYRYIRNPMYSAIILITLIWIINNFSFLRFSVWVILLIVLIIKIGIEEENLMKAFPGYEEYKSKTARLIPFVY